MAWLQLRLDCDPASADALEDTLLSVGALSVTLEDRADQPLLEPRVGETPLWDAIRLTGLFPADTDMGPVLNALPADRRDAARNEILEDKDWEREWMSHYEPMAFGERLWICPSWKTPPDPNAVNLLLDPGLAFGTGTHPTTAMCLEAVDRFTAPGQQVVDYGCGSGILGIAALKLGARHLLAVDNDPQALVASADNASRNGVDPDAIEVALPGAYDRKAWKGQSQLVLANILAGPLAKLADPIIELMAPGARLVLAGLLDTQVDGLVSAYAPRVALSVFAQRDEWVCLSGIRAT